MRSSLRVVSVVMGCLLLTSTRFKSDFTPFNVFIAFAFVVGLPMLLIIVPVILEFLERKRNK